MSRTAFHVVVFLVGLLAVCWIGIGYVSVHPLGAAVAAIIAACYIAGGVELYRYRQASNDLRTALGDLSSARESLGPWLERVPMGLRNAVRLRVEGERTALPAPVLTPYLVGLLVLLGMLGTLLGMMDTLRGTGLALQSATDMAAIRGSLASPVQGLAVAFGTSIAGVASSAMLGLLAALLRRDRLQAVQQLDRAIAGDLHPYSQAWQRAESLRLLQAQSTALPALVDRLQAMTDAFEQHSAAANERLLAGQAEFLTQSQALQERLAVSLQQSLREGAEASAAAIGGALQPMAETTLAGLAS
ncbi:TPA: MotA/TolQ/ExbB proton channel family protein, partial [Stenotrophomonas maltophilia]|nr:MotA/TolQ/ExbB proton channel family protein [Stenotrophomonas maltophilia]